MNKESFINYTYIKATMFTDSVKWDLFVIYIFFSIIFVGSCCVLLSCMFLNCPAKNQIKLNKPEISITTNPVVHINGNSWNELQIEPRCVRTLSLNTTQYYPHSEVELKNKQNKVSFKATIEPLPTRKKKSAEEN